MIRTPVQSTSISSIGYDVATMTLEVQFLQSGYVYQYQGVPHDVYSAFMAAGSKGQYLNYTIKNAYTYTRTE